MNNMIIKVKKNAREKSVENIMGWKDIRAWIKQLENLVPIVERKIRRGEQWPVTQSGGHDSEQQHSD